jgi:hypothetical protein
MMADWGNRLLNVIWIGILIFIIQFGLDLAYKLGKASCG